jgi:hypothetical protein
MISNIFPVTTKKKDSLSMLTTSSVRSRRHRNRVRYPKRTTRHRRNGSVLTSILQKGRKRKSQKRRSTITVGKKALNYCNPVTHEIMSDGACYQRCRRGWVRGPYNRCRLRENIYVDNERRPSLIPKNAMEKLGILDKQKEIRKNLPNNRIGVPEAMKVEKIEVVNQVSLVEDPVELDIYYENVILPADTVVAIKVRFEVNDVEQIADLHNYYISKRGRRKLHLKTDLGLNMIEMGLTGEQTSYSGLFSVTFFMFEKSFVKGIYRMKLDFDTNSGLWSKQIFSEEKPRVEFMPLFIDRPAN